LLPSLIQWKTKKNREPGKCGERNEGGQKDPAHCLRCAEGLPERLQQKTARTDLPLRRKVLGWGEKKGEKRNLTGDLKATALGV